MINIVIGENQLVESYREGKKKKRWFLVSSKQFICKLLCKLIFSFIMYYVYSTLFGAYIFRYECTFEIKGRCNDLI